jgi:hypothetical protein
VFVQVAADIFDKSHVRRTARSTQQLDASFFGRAVAFADVAAHTSTGEVLPRVESATRLRHDVIHRERWLRRAAVLAVITVAAEDILARKFDFFRGCMDVAAKANHAWKLECLRYGADSARVITSYQFSFHQKKQNYCLLHIADANRLVALVQHQHSSVQGLAERVIGIGIGQVVVVMHVVTRFVG